MRVYIYIYIIIMYVQIVTYMEYKDFFIKFSRMYNGMNYINLTRVMEIKT